MDRKGLGINTNSFKELIKKYNEYNSTYDDLESRYIDDQNSLDSEDLFDGMYSFNELYKDLNQLRIEIQQQLNVVSVREKTYQKYESYIYNIDVLINSTVTAYKTLKNLKYSFAYVSDLEDDTIKKFEIDIY